jgi:transcriptional regulator with GAF, ATPase, and Fis domain
VSASLPRVVLARLALLADLARGKTGTDVLQRHIAGSGLKALALWVPSDSEGRLTLRTAVNDFVDILRCCQTAEDDVAVLTAVCVRVRARLLAAGVAFVTEENGAIVTLASDGGRIDAGVAGRISALGQTIAPRRVEERIEGGTPVHYGGRCIGLLVARWTLGTAVDASAASALLTTAAAAAAPALAAVTARRALPVSAGLPDLLGASQQIDEVRRAVDRAAAAPFAVLVEGESGSGKELVARALHRRSPRRDRPFCTLNCAALPDDLVESELFGHARGAFTGAVVERQGVFEEAHTGTLFLDEIGELSLRAQAKVLRTIQEGELRRLGENVPRRIEVRIVAATNRDLRQEVAAGRFRLDLLYRLDVVRVVVPPLRDRRDDIPILAEHLWREATARLGSKATLSTGAVAALARYDWPGNVRELQNVLAALAVRSPRRGIVAAEALPPHFEHARPDHTWRLDEARRTFETRFIRAALARSGGHRARTAEELGVTRQGLTKLMVRLGITESA